MTNAEYPKSAQLKESLMRDIKTEIRARIGPAAEVFLLLPSGLTVNYGQNTVQVHTHQNERGETEQRVMAVKDGRPLAAITKSHTIDPDGNSQTITDWILYQQNGYALHITEAEKANKVVFEPVSGPVQSRLHPDESLIEAVERLGAQEIRKQVEGKN